MWDSPAVAGAGQQLICLVLAAGEPSAAHWTGGLCQVLKRSTNVCELVKLESAVCVPSVSLPVGEEEGVLAVCVYVYVRPTCKSC